MYSNDDLNNAVKHGIFTETSIADFRQYIAQSKNVNLADEENFKLISGFNDIFVVIACILLLVSVAWISTKIVPSYSMAIVALLAWGLAEFFVLKRKMSLPAIVLLLVFVGTLFAFFNQLFGSNAVMVSAALTAGATWLHWKRFKVPITVAAGMVTVIIFVLSFFISNLSQISNNSNLSGLIFLSGIVSFLIAMYWDRADLQRISNKSDTAFWLHLLSAPLIVHPIFYELGVFNHHLNFSGITIIVILYLLLSVISLIIDRKAFMVSSLIYVLVAFNTLFKDYGLSDNSFAISGVFIGFSLLLLSGYWAQVRNYTIKYLPKVIQQNIPIAKMV